MAATVNGNAVYVAQWQRTDETAGAPTGATAGVSAGAPTAAPKATAQPVRRNYDATPRTGDDSRLALWIGLMAASAVGVVAVLALRGINRGKSRGPRA